jgi:poly(3-hydroxybutyrate) depolymerase
VSMRWTVASLLCTLAAGLFPNPAPPDLADNTTCVALGFGDASQYTTSLPIPNLYNSSTSTPVFLPAYASLPLHVPGVSYPEVTTAVIALHGIGSDANDYFCVSMSQLAQSQEVVIVAPWLGTTQVRNRALVTCSTRWGDGLGRGNGARSGAEEIGTVWLRALCAVPLCDGGWVGVPILTLSSLQ